MKIRLEMMITDYDQQKISSKVILLSAAHMFILSLRIPRTPIFFLKMILFFYLIDDFCINSRLLASIHRCLVLPRTLLLES